MKAILHVCFLGEDAAGKRFRQDYAGKAVDLPFAPSVGMETECPAWEGAKKVTGVTLNVAEDEPYLYITLGFDVPCPEHYKGMIESYEIDGWELKV